jgi:predicted O-methyltransferase YrrM
MLLDYGFSAAPELLLLLREIIREEKPKVVLEMGSGLSTVVAAGALSENQIGKVTAWEHLDRYRAETQRIINAHGTESYGCVESVPLEELTIDGKAFTWFKPTHAIETEIDLLFVDSPPGHTGRSARFPAVPVLAPNFAADCIIILDDVHRPDEAETFSLWGEMLPSKRAKVCNLPGSRSFGILFNPSTDSRWTNQLARFE